LFFISFFFFGFIDRNLLFHGGADFSRPAIYECDVSSLIPSEFLVLISSAAILGLHNSMGHEAIGSNRALVRVGTRLCPLFLAVRISTSSAPTVGYP
jgi:hypothetical protein